LAAFPQIDSAVWQRISANRHVETKAVGRWRPDMAAVRMLIYLALMLAIIAVQIARQPTGTCHAHDGLGWHCHL
jgi:hypothetical protein